MAHSVIIRMQRLGKDGISKFGSSQSAGSAAACEPKTFSSKMAHHIFGSSEPAGPVSACEPKAFSLIKDPILLQACMRTIWHCPQLIQQVAMPAMIMLLTQLISGVQHPGHLRRGCHTSYRRYRCRLEVQRKIACQT